MITGTRTQVADTFSSGMPRILRDSLRTLSSSDDQPSSFTEPAHGTTLSASGAGNGESDVGPTGRPAASALGHVARPLADVLAGHARRARRTGGRCRPGRRRTPPGSEATTSSRSPNARCRAPIAAIIDSVVQFGLAMMPFGRSRDLRPR